jgi:hypothetical protein
LFLLAQVDDSDPARTFGAAGVQGPGLFDGEPASLLVCSGARDAVWQALGKCVANLQVRYYIKETPTTR